MPKSRARARVFVTVVLSASACTTNVDDSGVFGGTTGDPAATTAATTSGAHDDEGSTAATRGSTDATSGGATTTDAIKLDVGPAEGESAGETSPADGCDKIDFLFVVDNSASMAEEQQSLVASFPGFIDTIQDTVTATDYHVMVVDTDAESLSFGNGFACNGAGVCNCSPSPQCCYALCDNNGPIVFNPAPVACGGMACGAYVLPTGCNIVLGAGKTQDVLNADCGVAGGARYMTETQPDLAGTFECVALVGAGGDGNERPMEAMVNAVSAENEPTGCNDGFLRDDAILVVTVISDEDDLGSLGSPITWHQALVDAKLGQEGAVAVLGLFGDTALPNALCMEGVAEDAPTLRTFAESFTHGQWASVCEPDYSGFFADAVALIDTTCNEFRPQG